MESFTLQTSDSNVQLSDVLGRISFAASNETNSADARLIGASIHAEAEKEFTEVANPTSLVFSTANSESAIGKLKITSSGYLIPLNNKTYDIGSSGFLFRNLYAETNYVDRVNLNSLLSIQVTDDSIYSLSGILHFRDKAIALLPSGDFTSLKVNNITVSISGHDHLSSDITNFNSSVKTLVSQSAYYIGTLFN